jgi:hypothetical protein
VRCADFSACLQLQHAATAGCDVRAISDVHAALQLRDAVYIIDFVSHFNLVRACAIRRETHSQHLSAFP